MLQPAGDVEDRVRPNPHRRSHLRIAAQPAERRHPLRIAAVLQAYERVESVVLALVAREDEDAELRVVLRAEAVAVVLEGDRVVAPARAEALFY